MAWIESHTVLSRHRKVKETARALRIRPAYLIGHLHLLWHAALEQAEDGDLTRWSDEFIAESADYPGDAPQFVRLLQDHKWLDGKLLHDWPDYAGRYLIGKYAKDSRDRLVEIWSKYGKTYGKKTPKDSPTESQQDPNQTPRTPLGEVGKGSSPGSDSEKGKEGKRRRARALKTLIPPDWQPTPETLAWCAEHRLPEPEYQVLSFVTWWQGKGEARADWQATFRNWMTSPYRKDRPNAANRQHPGGYESAQEKRDRKLREAVARLQEKAGDGDRGPDYQDVSIVPEGTP